MHAELVKELIEKLDKKCYIAVMRHVSQNNRRIKISGFSALEKAPVTIVINTAKTKKSFKEALLTSCAAVILDGQTVDTNKSVQENKENVPRAQWLGVAAVFLLTEQEQFEPEILKIINEYEENVEPTVNAEICMDQKQDKREEKFREKYLKSRNEVERIKALLESQRVDCERIAAENDRIKQTVRDLEKERDELRCALDDKDRRIKQLKNELAKAQDSKDECQCKPLLAKNIRILAPNCKDILDKYVGRITIDFTDIAGKTKEELIKQYDQIWVLPNTISFATNRKLSKLKKEGVDNIVWFTSAADLLVKIEEII